MSYCFYDLEAKMIKSLNKFNQNVYIFLIAMLNIILAGSIILLIYGVYYEYISEYTPLLIYQNIRITSNYLLTSLCECIIGAFFLDYIFRKEN